MPSIKRTLKPSEFKTSFLSCEKDTEEIWKRLFVTSRPYSDILKRLLIIDKPDCLTSDRIEYQDIIDEYNLKKLKDEGYLLMTPRFDLKNHEKTKAWILLEFENFIPSSNLEYRNVTVSFAVFCNLDVWELNDYKLRAHQIAGYIDGIMNNARLSGIGTLMFMGAQNFTLDEYWGGIKLNYISTHGNEDKDTFEDAFGEAEGIEESE